MRPTASTRPGSSPRADGVTFKQIANGIPGIELRLPLLFSEGVGKGRIELNRFVALCCTNPARTYGLHPQKGTIAIGSDADLAIWDPERRVEVDDRTTHDATGYCPYAGMTLQGWPVTVISRGEVIVADGELRPGAAAAASCRARQARRRGPRAARAGARSAAQLRRGAALRRTQ